MKNYIIKISFFILSELFADKHLAEFLIVRN